MAEKKARICVEPERKIAVTKLVLQIGKKEIELSPEEAEKLHAALNELFGKEQAPAQQTLIIKETQLLPQPYPVPYNPAPIWYWNYPITISCQQTSSGNNWSFNSGTVTGSF